MELRLESFVQDTIKRKLDLYHVVVRQHGEIIGKFDWRENRREDIHSVSKSFLSIAIGIAIDEGILRLDEKPAEIFSDKLPESPSENLQAMTIRDMIMMAILLLMTGLSGMPLKMTTGFSMLWNLTFRINPGPTGNIIISAHIWHPLSFRNGPGNVLWIG